MEDGLYTVENRDLIQRKWQKYWLMNLLFNFVSIPFLGLGFFSMFGYPISDIDFLFVPLAMAGNLLIYLIIVLLHFSISLLVVRALHRKRHPDVKLFQGA